MASVNIYHLRRALRKKREELRKHYARCFLAERMLHAETGYLVYNSLTDILDLMGLMDFMDILAVMAPTSNPLCPLSLLSPLSLLGPFGPLIS